MNQVAINFILVTSIVAIGSCQNPESDYPPPGGGEQTGQGTDQGWDYGTAQAWYHIDQGTAFFPYEWFVALEQTGGQERFATPGHMQRFGFLPNPPQQPYNPDGLPIGFSRTELHLDKGQFQCWQGNWVGLTCAACHTGQVNYNGTALLIQGGPAQNDIETFRARLGDAFAANASNPEKAQRFVGRILAQQPELSPADVQAGLQCFGKASMARARFEQEALAAADEEPPSAAGPARLDALGRGGNSLFAESTGTVGNYKPTTAPVSFPALWDTPYFDWVLYNNSVRQPLARSVVEALGVGAPMDLSTLDAPELRHNVQMDNLVDIQLWLQDLKSPKWPEPVLGDIDQDLGDRGAEVYGANCASCHQVIDRDAHDASCPSRTEVVIPSYPIEAVGTDPRQAVNFATREITLGQQNQPLGAWVKLITDKVVGQYTADPKNAARAELVNCDLGNDFQVIEEYRARPLNGIWATAPYLHNGSVPDMVELLKPAAQRPATFYVGNWEFDPERLGFEWQSAFLGAFEFDTSITGNSNAGHEHGTELSDGDKRALIEYLKTL
jgi:mono/diheme cytochrome c family protein